jgi:hypothetical protein
MNKVCQLCGRTLEADWKLCPFCGPLALADVTTHDISIHESAIKEFRKNDAYNVINVGTGDIGKTSRKPEKEYEDYVIAILRSGGNLQTARIELDKHRERLGLTMGQANGIEKDCINRYGVFINKEPQIVEVNSDFTITEELGKELPVPHSEYRVPADFYTPGQREYIEFFTDVSRRFAKFVPIHLREPDGRYYYPIFFGRRSIHFEWYFGGRPRNRLGVELHFEGDDRRLNQKRLHEVTRYQNEIERLTGEKVILQYEWGRKNSRFYVEKTQGIINEELKYWAVEKMVIFYRLLQPRLKELK